MPRANGPSSEAEIRALRESISDVGHQIDSHKTKVAGALGGAVFTLLLALGAFYDLAAGKSGVWLTLGITRENLVWIAIALALGSLLLFAKGFVMVRGRNRQLVETLDRMERDYADLKAARDKDESAD